MPLDTQPLSTTRRTLMLAVLLTLLAASMGFAQLLIHLKTPALTINWNLPVEFKPQALPEEAGPDVVFVAAGRTADHTLVLVGLIADFPSPATPAQQTEKADELFNEITDAPPLAHRPGSLAHRGGIEVEAKDARGGFTLLRMISFSDKAIALGYSGAGEISDWDRLYFNQLCHKIEITDPKSPNRK